ncbi:MAG: hypothetical protein H3C34_10385 [Caldilineaceae bacterium]|nr:hypothetical protein [Caldilineaceae bacterium]
MDEKKPAATVIGMLIGFVLLLAAVWSAVNYLQAGQLRLKEEAAVAEGEVQTAPEGEAVAAAPPAETTAATEQPPAQTVARPAVPLAPGNVVAAFNKGGCAGCHVIPGIPGANGQIGPDLTTIGVDAAARREGTLTEQYVRESILDPNAYIAPECPIGPCPAGVMLQSFAQTLSEEDLETIVGYLALLGTDQAVPLVTEAAAPVALDATIPQESVLEPFQPLPKDPAPAAQIALGKYLFFDSRLSGNNSLSCASCHQPDHAFADGQALSKGYPSTQYFRNTPTILNTVFDSYLYWDGRMDGGDMPTLVRDHLTEAHFMSIDGRLMVERINQVPAYVDLFDQAFGGEPSFGRVLNAVTAYVQSLNSPAGAYDRYLAGETAALSSDAAAGLALFQGKAQCASCHAGARLTDGNFYNTGVATDPAMFEDPERQLTFRRFFRTLGTPNARNLTEDVGLYALTLEEADLGKFRTPSLREVGRTAPYMHNGSLATLDDVVRFYNEGGGPGQTAGLEPLNLTGAEIAQLVAFLEALSSEPVLVEAPTLPDYAIVSLGAGEAAQALPPAAEPAAAAPAPAEAPPEIVVAATKGTCIACHIIPGVPGAVGQVGPDLSNIGAAAGERKPGMSAEEYIHESIADPNAFIAPECPFGACVPGAMPANLATIFTPEELDGLVGYLLTLHDGGQ